MCDFIEQLILFQRKVFALFAGFPYACLQYLTYGQVKFKYLINHTILKLNAYRHRLITFSRAGSIYEMSLKIVYPQANRCQPSFRLNVSFAVNTEREGDMDWGQAVSCPHVVSLLVGGKLKRH